MVDGSRGRKRQRPSPRSRWMAGLRHKALLCLRDRYMPEYNEILWDLSEAARKREAADMKVLREADERRLGDGRIGTAGH